MKNNAILIVVECDNANIVYQEVIPMVKKHCREYFGNKHFWEGPEFSPICYTNELILKKTLIVFLMQSTIRLFVYMASTILL